ncbi:helix-turn-helix domain-containing protein [Pedobacter sp. L105]|uniref:AraC family transcriptional regulator n=1 Tax=Pedobacter sp. L105 TaxID=1641871 RepID=UPI00131B2296|nr:helix-turn-helix domain-containing protein [Pedobacter sp. L105]
MVNPAIINLEIETSLSDSFSIERLTSSTFPLNHFFRVSFNQFIFLEKGRGTIQIDGADYTVAANSLILLAKNQVYSFSRTTDFAGYSLCFGDCFWDKTPVSANNCKAALFNDITANQHIQLSLKDRSSLSGLFEDTFTEYEAAPYVNKGDVLAAFLKILMIKIANINSLLLKVNGQQDDKIYHDFITLLEHQYEISHDVTYFAEKLHISARKLTELCRKYAGKGAKDIIQDHLIAEAKRSLQFSSGSIKEIAFKLNFSPYQFSHFFKKNTSLSPESYRKQTVEIDM